MSRVLGVDPGPTQSAWVVYDAADHDVVGHGYAHNDDVIQTIRSLRDAADHLAIEMVTSYGKSVKDEVFETALTAGRLVEAWDGPWTRVYRKKHNYEAGVPGVVPYLNQTMNGNDATVRTELINRFGGTEESAIGGDKCPKCKGKGWYGRGRPTCLECDGSGWEHEPGPLYGIAGDEWAALAVALTFAEASLSEEVSP